MEGDKAQTVAKKGYEKLNMKGGDANVQVIVPL